MTKESLQHQAALLADGRRQMNHKEKEVQLFNLVKACVDQASQQPSGGVQEKPNATQALGKWQRIDPRESA